MGQLQRISLLYSCEILIFNENQDCFIHDIFSLYTNSQWGKVHQIWRNNVIMIIVFIINFQELWSFFIWNNYLRLDLSNCMEQEEPIKFHGISARILVCLLILRVTDTIAKPHSET